MRKAPSSDVLNRLKAAAGPGGYLDGEADMAPFCKSWRDDWLGQVPLVLRPKSTIEVASLVRICAETDTAIVPQGGRTGLTGASQPHNTRTEVIITTDRMRTIRDIDLGNDTLSVDAGVVLQTIQTLARDNDRFFPMSLGAEGSCQIGGNIATNAGGINVLRYGTTRNLVLGLEAVLPDGRIWDGMRGLRKDNTGFDLKHLLIGSEGTIGIITGAVLKLFPKPTASETALVALPDVASAIALLSHMKAALGEQVSAFELIGRSLIDITLKHVAGHDDPMPDRHPWYVLLRVDSQGEPGSLKEALANALAAAMEQGLVVDAILASSDAQAQKLWRMREDFAEAQRLAGGVIGHDISVPVSKIPAFLARADVALVKAYPGVTLAAFGHVGDGNLHYNPARPNGWDPLLFKAERSTVNRIVHDIVVSLGGSISAEHGIGRLRLEENYHYKSAVEMDLMHAIKRAFDPANIMNPGKVFLPKT